MDLLRDYNVPIIDVNGNSQTYYKNLYTVVSSRLRLQINFPSYSDERSFIYYEELFANKLINLIILLHCNKLHKLLKLVIRSHIFYVPCSIP